LQLIASLDYEEKKKGELRLGCLREILPYILYIRYGIQAGEKKVASVQNERPLITANSIKRNTVGLKFVHACDINVIKI
jgi:hypothetical protein